MVFAMASEVERELILSRTKEALRDKKAQGIKLGRPKGTGKSNDDETLFGSKIGFIGMKIIS